MKQIYNLIIKSILQKKKYLYCMTLVNIFSFLCIMLFAFYGKASHEYEKSEYVKCCGRYDLYIVYASDEDIDKYGKKDACLFNYKYLENDDIFFITSQENYLDFSEYQLIDGDFPDSSSEVVCEPWLLMQEGITDSEMLGSSITINNKKYTVSGLIQDTSYTIDEDPSALGHL